MHRLLRTRSFPPRDDTGAALITVILMLALMTALTLTVCVVTTNNLVSARLSQQAGSAVNASDAGVAQAVTYLRSSGVRNINCYPATCPTGPWTQGNPTSVTINGKAKQSYQVWIEPLAKFPANNPGRYRIHSTGVAGGPAGRSVTVDVYVSPLDFVMGMMAGSVVGGGNAGVHYESIFSSGCVYQRSKILFQGIDVAYGLPAAVHSSQIITDSNGSGRTCPDTNKPIHDPTKPVAADRICNPLYPYDQDKNGGPLTGTTCYNMASSPTPTGFGSLPQFNDSTSLAYKYPQTSFMDDTTLAKSFKAKRPVFTQSQLDELKSIAVSQNNYWTTSKPYQSPSQLNGWKVPTDPDSVMYFDLTANDPGGMVDLNNLAVSPWTRPANIDSTNPACTPRSLLIIIEGGNARLNANSSLAASLFLVSDDPYGYVFKANGSSTFIGNIYANNIDLTGTTDLYMDKCFMDNISPALARYDTKNYREVDR